MCKTNKDEILRTPIVSFDNTKKEILDAIHFYILHELKIKATITSKKGRKKNHTISYCLKYTHFNKCTQILSRLNLYHPIKMYRRNLILNELAKTNKRNGKYTAQQINERLALEEQFFSYS